LGVGRGLAGGWVWSRGFAGRGWFLCSAMQCWLPASRFPLPASPRLGLPLHLRPAASPFASPHHGVVSSLTRCLDLPSRPRPAVLRRSALRRRIDRGSLRSPTFAAVPCRVARPCAVPAPLCPASAPPEPRPTRPGTASRRLAPASLGTACVAPPCLACPPRPAPPRVAPVRCRSPPCRPALRRPILCRPAEPAPRRAPPPGPAPLRVALCRHAAPRCPRLAFSCPPSLPQPTPVAPDPLSAGSSAAAAGRPRRLNPSSYPAPHA
jgi:hypothetical protein